MHGLAAVPETVQACMFVSRASRAQVLVRACSQMFSLALHLETTPLAPVTPPCQPLHAGKDGPIFAVGMYVGMCPPAALPLHACLGSCNTEQANVTGISQP